MASESAHDGYLDAKRQEAAERFRLPVASPASSDPVNHPSHYTSHPSGIECVDVIEHMTLNVGNAVKYLWRHDDKGNPIEDLRKAIWYIEREIQRRSKP